MFLSVARWWGASPSSETFPLDQEPTNKSIQILPSLAAGCVYLETWLNRLFYFVPWNKFIKLVHDGFYHCSLPFHLTSNCFSFNLPTKWISGAVGAESQASTWPSTAIWLQQDRERAEPDQAGQQLNGPARFILLHRRRRDFKSKRGGVGPGFRKEELRGLDFTHSGRRASVPWNTLNHLDQRMQKHTLPAAVWAGIISKGKITLWHKCEQYVGLVRLITYTRLKIMTAVSQHVRMVSVLIPVLLLPGSLPLVWFCLASVGNMCTQCRGVNVGQSRAQMVPSWWSYFAFSNAGSGTLDAWMESW